MRRLAASVATVALIAVGLGVAPPALAGDPCYHSFEMPPRTEGTDSQIKVMPCAFAPTVTRVPVGTTVDFFSGSDVVHLITGANQEWGSRDVELEPERTVSYRFDKPGIYPYACALHRGMSGAIVVGDGLAAAAPAAAPGTEDPTAVAATAPASSSGAAGAEVRPLVAIGAIAAVLAIGVLLAVRRRPTAA